MRVTVCELPHRTDALADAWAALAEHTTAHASQLVLLPELAMVEPVWEFEHFDAARWVVVETAERPGAPSPSRAARRVCGRARDRCAWMGGA